MGIYLCNKEGDEVDFNFCPLCGIKMDEEVSIETPFPKACPHCECRDISAWIDDNPMKVYYYVRCDDPDCRAEICSPISMEDAVIRWNRRSK